MTLQEVSAFPCGEENCKYDQAQEVLDLKYSPDGSHLIAVGSEKNVVLFRCDGPQHQVSCKLYWSGVNLFVHIHDTNAKIELNYKRWFNWT